MGLSTSSKNARRFFLALAFVVLPMAAQTGLGVVSGTVQDSSKSVIPNAKVTLTNTATGVGRDTLTNAAGIYYFGAVQIGPYTLAVEATRVKKWEGTLSVQAGQTAIIDTALEVGSLQAAVVGTAVGPCFAPQGVPGSDAQGSLPVP